MHLEGSGARRRVGEHNAGTYGGFTKKRRPVELVFHKYFEMTTDAVAAERRLKGWSRVKKEALTQGDLGALRQLSKEAPILRDARFACSSG